MKSVRSFVLAVLSTPTLLFAQVGAPEPLAPPASGAATVYPAPTPDAAPVAPGGPVYVYDQKQAATGRPFLISPEQAQSIINRFKDEYKKLGSPRVIIYVNRELIDESSGLKLTSHKKVVETTRPVADRPANAANGQNTGVIADAAHPVEHVASTNIYRARDRKELTLADRQTMRDVERLIGRPLRMAGVQLADQRVASQIMGGTPVDNFAIQPDGDHARRDREALTKIADLVLEVLVSSKDNPVTELSGDRSYPTPDLQITAIRLSDARILGQATAADLIGQGSAAGRAMRNFGIREIAEATALSLMEDMMLQ